MTQRLRWATALFAISLLTTPTTFGQIYSEPSGGTWSNAATWVGGVVPTQGDHAVVRGTVSVNGSTTVAALTVETGATLQIQTGGDRTLTVTGSVTNNGTIRDRHDGNWWLSLVVGGDLTNNGTWANYRTTLNGTGNQAMSQAAGTNWGSPITSDKTSGELVAGSNLEFSQKLSMNNDVLRMGGYDLAFRGGGYIQSGVVYTTGGLAQYEATLAASEGTRYIGTVTVRNEVIIGQGNVFEGSLVVDGTLRNLLNRDVTNTIEGNVTNNGTIQNAASSWWLTLNVTGDINNYGEWSNRATNLTGSGNQTIEQAPRVTFVSPVTSNKDTGEILAGSALSFSAKLSLNEDILRMQGNDLIFRGGGYVQSGVIYTDGGLVQYDGTVGSAESTRFIGTTTIRNLVNLGHGNVFEGSLVVADTLQNIINRDPVNTVEGHVINNGTIRNAHSSWWLLLNVTGDLTNNGVWSNRSVTLTGTGDQTLSQSDGTTWGTPIISEKPSGFVRASSDLDFSSTFDLNTDSLYAETHGITVRGAGMVRDANVFLDGFLKQVGSTSAAVESSRFSGTTRIRERVSLGSGNRFAGTVVVEDTLQNRMSCDCTATIEGHLINEGTIRNIVSSWWLYLNLQGSVTNRGVEWSNRSNYLNGDGMRTWDAPGVTAPMTMNGGNVTLIGENAMGSFAVSSENGPHVASGASFQVPPNSSDRVTNEGRLYVREDVSGGGTYGLHWADFRVAAGAFDSLEVSHFGNQAPYSFSNAVRSYWTVRSVPEMSSNTIDWMTFGYEPDLLGNNVESELHVFHSDNDGSTWRQISSEGNITRDLNSHSITLNSVPSSGMFVLSSDPDMVTVLPTVITSVIGRDQIRLGPPNRYTIHYANNSDVATGDMMMLINVNRNIHIDHIEPSAPEGVTVDWLYPEDFAIYGDSTAAIPDTIAVLILQSMAPHEERSFDIVLDAYPDGYDPNGKVVIAPAIGVVLWWAATGIATSYAADMTFNVVEESFARTDGVRPVISEAFRKTNQKWFSFEKPATELAKDLALTWGQGIIGGTLGTAAVIAVKVGEGFFNFMKAVACGSDRYVNGRQTISACIDKPVEKVTSWDPNEKIGPTGYGPGGFVTDASRVTYQILFENKAEAQAPAWRITIDDTLSTVFDASTVKFEGASHEGFNFNVDGQALHWEIEGIELPPNVTPPEGEGYVLFSVETTPGLPSGTALENRAVIVFDYNPPIMTNTFVNTLDFQAPTTTMEPLPTEVAGGELTVRWTASDPVGESGVQSTNLFMSMDGGAFESVGSTFADSMVVDLEPMHEYRFYALSKDFVGNAETVRPELSTVNVISGVATESEELPFEFRLDAAYPNPFNPVTTIAYSLPTHGPAQLVIFDTLGRRVATLLEGDQLPGQHRIRWNAENHASGVYFYQLTQGHRSDTRAFVLLK